MKKFEKLNKNVETCNNIEKRYTEISIKNKELKALNQEI